MNALARIGAPIADRAAYARYLAAVAWAGVRLACASATWPRTVRNVLARQILFTGVEASWFIGTLGLLVGVSVVVQAQLWLTKLGQSGLLGPILVAVIVREAGPLLVNFAVIGRSGTAISTELANMRVHDEIRVMEAQGLDPLRYLVVPRMVGVMTSVFGLTILFIALSLVSGYVCGLLMGAHAATPGAFASSIFREIGWADWIALVTKTLIPGMLTGVICSLEGLGIRGSVTEVPQASTRAVVKSIMALFLVSAVISVLTYL